MKTRKIIYSLIAIGFVLILICGCKKDEKKDDTTPTTPTLIKLELVNIPEPVPSEVLLSAMVGLADKLQHTPREVMAAAPSLVIFPPLNA